MYRHVFLYLNKRLKLGRLAEADSKDKSNDVTNNAGYEQMHANYFIIF